MRHFLVVASASRGARFFIKNALERGHSVTALCRAKSDKLSLERMNNILDNTILTKPSSNENNSPGRLRAKCSNIFLQDTFKDILNEDPSIDSICCFVGPTKFKDMMSSKNTIYTDTINAIVKGIEKSRPVDIYFHSSVGVIGTPKEASLGSPQNFPLFSKLVINFTPVFRNLVKSERILANSNIKGVNYIIFRPAALTDKKAKRHYGYCFNDTGLNNQMLPLKYAKSTISREDVAEEILRVTELDKSLRKKWYGNAVYMADIKSKFNIPIQE